MDDLQDMIGTVKNDTDLGTFNGSSIDNGATVKSALQSVDTELDASAQSRGAIMTLSSSILPRQARR